MGDMEGPLGHDILEYLKAKRRLDELRKTQDGNEGPAGGAAADRAAAAVAAAALAARPTDLTASTKRVEPAPGASREEPAAPFKPPFREPIPVPKAPEPVVAPTTPSARPRPAAAPTTPSGSRSALGGIPRRDSRDALPPGARSPLAGERSVGGPRGPGGRLMGSVGMRSGGPLVPRSQPQPNSAAAGRQGGSVQVPQRSRSPLTTGVQRTPQAAAPVQRPGQPSRPGQPIQRQAAPQAQPQRQATGGMPAQPQRQAQPQTQPGARPATQYGRPQAAPGYGYGRPPAYGYGMYR